MADVPAFVATRKRRGCVPAVVVATELLAEPNPNKAVAAVVVGALKPAPNEGIAAFAPKDGGGCVLSALAPNWKAGVAGDLVESPNLIPLNGLAPVLDPNDGEAFVLFTPNAGDGVFLLWPPNENIDEAGVVADAVVGGLACEAAGDVPKANKFVVAGAGCGAAVVVDVGPAVSENCGVVVVVAGSATLLFGCPNENVG